MFIHIPDLYWMVEELDMSNSRVVSKKSSTLPKPTKYIVLDNKDEIVYCPKRMPQKRSKKLTNCVAAFIAGGIFIGIAFTYGLRFTLEAVAYGQILGFCVELIWRSIHLLEEYFYHFTSRYGKSYSKLLHHIFHFSQFSIILLFVSLLFTMWSFMKYGNIEINNKPLETFGLLGLFLLKKINHMEQAPIYTSLKIEEDDGLNCGSSMAYSFFYGYLKLLFEKTGGQDKNLTELIENYSDSQGVKFPVAKLFILLPKSSICHVSLVDELFPNIEESSSLPEKIKTVAGVKDRVYKNSVYKIYDQERQRRVYICAEYATPLKTFKQGLEFGPHSGNYKAHMDDIVLQFYRTLNELLRCSPEIRNLCDLIYYDDMDEDGNFTDVAEILLSRVKHFEFKSKKLK